jgi:hypothetical protein
MKEKSENDVLRASTCQYLTSKYYPGESQDEFRRHRLIAKSETN